MLFLNNLSHLPKVHRNELCNITQRIVRTGKAELVMLFGSYARGDYTTIKNTQSGKQSDYDILVVTADADTRKGLRRKLRRAFQDIEITVQLLVEKIQTVNRNLEEEQYFFTDIKREGKLLYSSGNFVLSEPRTLSATRRREIAETDFQEWFRQAKSFYRSAKHDLHDGEFRTAAFHLQQVVEMCYTTLEMVFDHYNPHEHNLKSLYYRIRSYDRRISDAFPLKSAEQIALFDHLNLAYIGGRYHSHSEYMVTEKQLTYWFTEAEKLLSITQSVCLDRIAQLQKHEYKN